MKFFDLINNFTRGEVGAKVTARTETEAYNNSCENMINFIPQVEGGAKKRNSFRVVPDSVDGYIAIHSFKYALSEDYRIYMKIVDQTAVVGGTPEMQAKNVGNKMISCRVYSSDRYLDKYYDFTIDCFSLALKMDTLELQDLHAVQWEDMVVFTDPAGIVPPFYIYRRDAIEDGVGGFSETELQGYVFNGGFWCDPIHKALRISFGQNAIDATIPEPLEPANFFALGGRTDAPTEGEYADEINFSKFPYEYFDVKLTAGGTTANRVTLDVEDKDFNAIQQIVNDNKHLPISLRDDNLLHVACRGAGNLAGAGGVGVPPYTKYTFTCFYNSTNAPSSDYSATKDALTHIIKKAVVTSGSSQSLSTRFLAPYNASTETVEFSKLGVPEWGENNWPRTVAVHQQRLVFGGTKRNPTKVWCSKTGSPFIFISQPRTYWDDEVGDATAFNFVPVTGLGDPISSLTSMGNLIVGTRSSISNVLSNGAFAKRNIVIRKEHGVGFARLKSQVVGNSLIAIDSSKKHLISVNIIGDANDRTQQLRITDQNNDIIYSGFDERLRLFLETDLSDVEIKKILWDDQDRVLWILTNIGSLVGVRLDTDNGVLGFFRVVFPVETLIKDMAIQTNTQGTKSHLYITTSDDKVLAYSDSAMLDNIRIEDAVLTNPVGGTAINSRYLEGEGTMYIDYAQKYVVPFDTKIFNTGYAHTQISVFEYETGQAYSDTTTYSLGDNIYYKGSYFRCDRTIPSPDIAPDTISSGSKIGAIYWKPLKTQHLGTFTSDKDGNVDLSLSNVNLDAQDGGGDNGRRPVDIVWGLPYLAYAKTNPTTNYEVRKERSLTLLEAFMRLYKSRGGRVGTTVENVVDIEYKGHDNEIVDGQQVQSNITRVKGDGRLSLVEHLGYSDLKEPELFTGMTRMDLPSDTDAFQSIVFEQDEPFPFYVVGLFVRGDMS